MEVKGVGVSGSVGEPEGGGGAGSASPPLYLIKCIKSVEGVKVAEEDTGLN
jgi:hypothetical protein